MDFPRSNKESSEPSRQSLTKSLREIQRIFLQSFKAEMIGKIVPSSKGSKKEELRVILKSKRGNQTRYIRTLLKSMALALIEMRIDLQDHYILSLPKRIDNCHKIKDISEMLADPDYSEFRRLVQTFVVPGEKFIKLLACSSYPSVIKMLLVEALPGLSMMVRTPAETVTSWELQKMQTKGDYTAALKLLQNSSEPPISAKFYKSSRSSTRPSRSLSANALARSPTTPFISS
jgi:hypothetical protein